MPPCIDYRGVGSLRGSVCAVIQPRPLCCRAALPIQPMLTRTSQGLAIVRTGDTHPHSAYRTYLRRRAACSHGATYCTGYAHPPRPYHTCRAPWHPSAQVGCLSPQARRRLRMRGTRTPSPTADPVGAVIGGSQSGWLMQRRPPTPNPRPAPLAPWLVALTSEIRNALIYFSIQRPSACCVVYPSFVHPIDRASHRGAGRATASAASASRDQAPALLENCTVHIV